VGGARGRQLGLGERQAVTALVRPTSTLPPELDGQGDGAFGPDDAYHDTAEDQPQQPAPDGPDPDILRAASLLPINDLGNGQRFVLHFGRDVMFVPRVGWHVWDGRVWEVDPDMIRARAKAQRLSALVLAEVPYLVLSDDRMAQIAREADLRAERDTLELQRDDDGKLSDVAESRISRIKGELATIEGHRNTLSKLRTNHRTFARSTGNTGKIKAAMTEAEVPLAKRVEDLDQRPLDVNTGSGILRFTVTPRVGTYPAVSVERLDHDRALCMTKIIATGYDAAANTLVLGNTLIKLAGATVTDHSLTYTLIEVSRSTT
jgi:putative DNA primase/helicase